MLKFNDMTKDGDNILFVSADGIPFDRPRRANHTSKPSFIEIFERVSSSTAEEGGVTISGITQDIYDLRDGDDAVAISAQAKLVSLGVAVVPALVRCFELTVPPGLEDFGVSSIDDEYGKVIEIIGAPATDELVDATEIPNRYMVRLRAINALGRIKDGDATKIIPGVLGAMEEVASETADTNIYSTNGLLIKEAGNVLKNLKTTDPLSHSRILALLSHHDGLIRECGYQAISHHVNAQTAVPALINNFNEEEKRKNGEYNVHIEILQGYILHALARYGKEDSRVAPFLIDQALNNIFAESDARQVIEPKNCNAEDVVPFMIAELKNPTGKTGPALHIIQNYGTAASEAVPLIIEMINQKQLDQKNCDEEVIALGVIALKLAEPLQGQAKEALEKYKDVYLYRGWIDIVEKLYSDSDLPLSDN